MECTTALTKFLVLVQVSTNIFRCQKLYVKIELDQFFVSKDQKFYERGIMLVPEWRQVIFDPRRNLRACRRFRSNPCRRRPLTRSSSGRSILLFLNKTRVSSIKWVSRCFIGALSIILGAIAAFPVIKMKFEIVQIFFCRFIVISKHDWVFYVRML